MADSLESRNGIEPEDAGKAEPAPVGGIPQGARRIAFVAALLVLPATVAGWATGGWDRAIGVLAGSALVLADFWLLARMVVDVTTGVERGTLEVLGQLMGKLALVGGLLAAMVLILRLDAVGVLVGLSLVFVAVVLETVVGRRNDGAPQGPRDEGERRR